MRTSSGVFMALWVIMFVITLFQFAGTIKVNFTKADEALNASMSSTFHGRN